MIFRKKEPALEVFIGAETEIRGDITTKGAVRMDGSCTGSISADWIIIGESGSVQGDVTARGTVVYGKLHGNIDSTELTDIRAKAVVEGDVNTAKLSISEGAFFEGRSHMRKAQPGAGEVVSIDQKIKKSFFD